MTNAMAYTDQGAATGSAREQLILDHLPQVRWIAMRIHEKLPETTALEDLISVGIIGLINAIDNFDPAYNVKLKTYAEHKIRGAILDSIRGLDGVPAHKRRRVKQIQAAIETVEQREQRAPSEEEIAAELGISVREYQDWLLDIKAVSIGSLDATPEPGSGAGLLNLICDTEENAPNRILERAELEKLIQEGLRKMPRVERTVLDLYFREEQNMREIAPILNLHITRVSQLKAQAILRLRAYIEKRWPRNRGIY
jgi:RNA polymerase sigma factor FliA